ICSEPVVAEAKTLLQAINVAAQSGLTTTIKSDCLTLIEGLSKGPTCWPWQCAAWMHQMDRTLEDNPLIRVSFTPRRQNNPSRSPCQSGRKRHPSD
ncbi:hypothetical protein LINGRAHAP2_LOCUS16922, partial [Linum grandiflorum]